MTLNIDPAIMAKSEEAMRQLKNYEHGQLVLDISKKTQHDIEAACARNIDLLLTAGVPLSVAFPAIAAGITPTLASMIGITVAKAHDLKTNPKNEAAFIDSFTTAIRALIVAKVEKFKSELPSND